jgi:hypothetical protein
MKSFRIRYDITADLPSTVVHYGPLSSPLALKSSGAASPGILSLFEAVRIREIHLWGPAVTAAVNTIGVEFLGITGSQFAPGVNTLRTNDSSTSTTGSSMVSRRPEKGSLAGQWMNVTQTIISGGGYTAFGSTACVAVTCPQNGVLDVVWDVVVSDGSFPAQYVSASSTALAYGLYAVTLATNIVPQDYNTYI